MAMKAKHFSPPLLLIFFHDKGWLQPHTSSGAPPMEPNHLRSSVTSASGSVVSRPTSEKATHHFEFLLFSYLLRFAHREGRVGDLARAGLLFLFDIAFLTASEEGGDNLQSIDTRNGDALQDARDALGEFILDGDFADVMSAGIGAIYSLLPTKLRVPTLADQATTEEGLTAFASGGMHLGGNLPSNHPSQLDLTADLALASTSDPVVRDKVDLLLKLFGFLQDIIHRCNSPVLHASPDTSAVEPAHVLGAAISEATLDAVQSSFLDTVIYPSILESSPGDGSSVAVMTYLDILFSNLDDGPLLSTIIEFLMDTGDLAAALRAKKPSGSTDALRTDYFADEGRFTLKDLMLDNLRSVDPSASTTALKLLQTLLGDHCRLSIKGLLSIARDPAATALARKPFPSFPSVEAASPSHADSYLPSPVNSTDLHLQEVELYGSLISRIDPLQTSAELAAGYAGYLADVHNNLQADPCFVGSLVPLQFMDDETASIRIGRFDHEPIQHRLNPGDPLISTLLGSFGAFFCQMPDENVALTGAMTALAMCPNRSLAGWLLYDIQSQTDPWSSQQKLPDDDMDGASDVSWDDIEFKRRENGMVGTEGDPFGPPRAAVDLPAIYQVFRDLVRQVNRFRLDIDDFDRLLSERRQGLLFADHLDEAMNVMLDVEPTVFGLPSPSIQSSVASPIPKRPKPGPLGGGLGGALKSFLTPKRKSSPATLTPGRGLPGSLRDAASKVNSSPFKSHYEQTSLMTLEASPSAPVASGPWSPGKIPRRLSDEPRPKSALSQVETASMGSSLRGGAVGDMSLTVESGDGASVTPRKVTLSSVLDNCVVLEEFLKETVAVITARRALGIDQVGFV